jgi:hypothetical protein
MSTRYAKIQKSLGTPYFTVNGREFAIYQRKTGDGRERVLSEILERNENSVSTLPGYWRGQKRTGHDFLVSAGVNRRHAMRDIDPFRKAAFKRRAREAVEAARLMREAMPIFAIEEASPALARELRSAA